MGKKRVRRGAAAAALVGLGIGGWTLISGAHPTGASSEAGPSHNIFEAGQRLDCASGVVGGGVIDHDGQQAGSSSLDSAASGLQLALDAIPSSAARHVTFLADGQAEVEYRAANGDVLGLGGFVNDDGWKAVMVAACGGGEAK